VQDLQVFVKIRLMLAAAGEFDILSTLKAVRTFALLMLTTENQQLMLGGLTILEDENFAYQFFVNELKFDSTRWEPIDLQIIRRAHRAILATSSYMHLWTHPDLLEKIYLGEPPPVGFCAAANESLPIEFSMRGALEPQLPLEMNFQREYNTLDAIYRKAHETCRVRYLMEMSAFDAFRSDAHGPLILEGLPYWRKLFGLRKSLLHYRGFPDYSQK
jgi:hypothetical protein